MGFTKSQRIGILLGIDAVFFLVELVVGYAVHSLALVADSFHMLNDVLSLCVGLWAVRVANTGSSKMYTYGWQRAETLGALVNGVFLVALCLSIFLEAIQRFVEPQVVTNPKLVLIVGCMGLASNILGLLLFHDHGHSHGHEEQGDAIKSAEEGHGHVHDDEESGAIADESGNIEDVLPQVRVAGYKGTDARRFTTSDEENTTISAQSSNTQHRKSLANSEIHNRHRRRTSGSLGRGFGSVDNIHIHPASFRQEIIQAARLEEQSEESSEDGEALLDDTGSPNEHSQILPNGHSSPLKGTQGYGSIGRRRSMDYNHAEHTHNQPKGESHKGHSHGGHGHSHGDLNMRGVFLHVMGDALGNIGVIASALIIWLTHFPGRYYFDPGISLVITIIILYSAIPLCKAASRILLQAVPVGLSIDEITDDIESLPRVLSAHHLHVWQLSDTKLVASLHVKVDCEVEGAGSASYMHLAREIRGCLHGYGIHSSTIQPEFTTPQPDPGTAEADNGHLNAAQAGTSSKAASVNSEGPTCLLECGDKCAGSKMCCPTDGKNGSQNGKK